MKSGTFNFLEPSGRLQACNGTATSFACFQTLMSKPESLSTSINCNSSETVVKLYVQQKTKELHLTGSQFGHSTVSVNRVVDHTQMRFAAQFPDVFRKVSELEKRVVFRANFCLT